MLCNHYFYWMLDIDVWLNVIVDIFLHFLYKYSIFLPRKLQLIICTFRGIASKKNKKIKPSMDPFDPSVEHY